MRTLHARIALEFLFYELPLFHTSGSGFARHILVTRIHEGVIPRQRYGRTKTCDPLDRRRKQCFLCPSSVSITPEDVGGSGIGSIAVGFDGPNESNRTQNRYRSSELVSRSMNRRR